VYINYKCVYYCDTYWSTRREEGGRERGEEGGREEGGRKREVCIGRES
jgi:hypothetical protein